MSHGLHSCFVLRIVLFWHIAKVSNNLTIVIQYSILLTLTHSLTLLFRAGALLSRYLLTYYFASFFLSSR